MGIALGLFIGKQIGIFGLCWLALQLGLTKLPKGMNYASLFGTAALCGAATSLYGKSGITYKPVYGLQEYKTPLTGSAKNLKLEISIESNGFDASLQDLTLLHKQGKIR